MSDAIRCPSCGAMKSRIRDSRPSKKHANAVQRRRVCACGERFTTLEMTSYDIDALIEANRVLFQLAERAQQALEQEPPNEAE